MEADGQTEDEIWIYTQRRRTITLMMNDSLTMDLNIVKESCPQQETQSYK